MKRASIAVLLLAALPGVVALALSEEEEPKAPGVESLSWMAGRWVARGTDDVWEETWSRPEGDSLVGMTRWIVKGKVKLYEFMVIEKEGDGLAFRMRHFNRALAGWISEKEGPLVYAVRSVADQRLVLEDAKRDFPRTIVYRREGDSLTVTLSGAEGGKPKSAEFHFERAGG